MICNNCGKNIENNSIFCIYCGNKINDINNNTSTKRKDNTPSISVIFMVAVILLCIASLEFMISPIILLPLVFIYFMLIKQANKMYKIILLILAIVFLVLQTIQYLIYFGYLF